MILYLNIHYLKKKIYNNNAHLKLIINAKIALCNSSCSVNAFMAPLKNLCHFTFSLKSLSETAESNISF